MQNLLVAKIGGSLAGGPDLARWLDVLAAWPGPLVISPGGGILSSGVRQMQRAMQLNDLAAHKMALLALDQYAIALAAVRPSPAICATDDEFRAVFANRRIAIWAPARMAGAATDIPATWRAASDSLAAWLAAKLGAAHLLLIKNADPPSPASTEGLSRRNLVDGMFPDFAAKSALPIWIAGPSALRGASDLLSGGRIPGARVTALRRTQAPA